MLILVGESSSGKSTIEKILCEEYGYKKVTSYTTRQPRSGEVDGVDYHFISAERFDTLYNQGFLAETGYYNNWHYGSSIYDCTNDKVAVLTPHGMRQLKKNKGLDIISFYIKVPRRDRLMKILERGDNIEEAYRRNISDVGQYDGIEDEVDFIVENNGYETRPEFMAKHVDFLYKSTLMNRNKKEKLTILCDIDGVVNDLVEKVIAAYNKKYNDNINVNDITEYNVQQFLKPECKNVWMEFCTDELLSTLEPTQDSLEVITELMGKHDFYFLSRTFPAHVKAKDQWLREKFPLYTDKMLITCANKHLVHGDILIDDYLDNLNENVKLNLIFDKPWNQAKIKSPNIKRVYSWNDIKAIIDSYK